MPSFKNLRFCNWYSFYYYISTLLHNLSTIQYISISYTIHSAPFLTGVGAPTSSQGGESTDILVGAGCDSFVFINKGFHTPVSDRTVSRSSPNFTSPSPSFSPSPSHTPIYLFSCILTMSTDSTASMVSSSSSSPSSSLSSLSLDSTQSEKKQVKFHSNKRSFSESPSLSSGKWSYAAVQQANAKRDYRVNRRIRFVPRPPAISADANRKLPSSSFRFAIWPYESESVSESKEEKKSDGIEYGKIIHPLKYLERHAIHQTRIHKFRQLLHSILTAGNTTVTKVEEFINSQVQAASFAWAMDPDSLNTPQPWHSIDRQKEILANPLIITVVLPSVEAAQRMQSAISDAAKKVISMNYKFLPLEQRYFRFRLYVPLTETVEEIKAKLKAIGFGSADAAYWIENDDGDCRHISYRSDRNGGYSRRRLIITAPFAYYSLLSDPYFDEFHQVQVWMQPSLKSCSRCGLLGRPAQYCSSHYCEHQFNRDERRLCLGCGTHRHNHTTSEEWQHCIAHSNKSLGCIFCGQYSHSSNLCSRHVSSSSWIPLLSTVTHSSSPSSPSPTSRSSSPSSSSHRKKRGSGTATPSSSNSSLSQPSTAESFPSNVARISNTSSLP